VLATKVSRKQAQMLKKENLPGIGFDAVSQRVYPEGQLASQVLGFVDAEGKGKYGGVVLEEGTFDYFYSGSINHCLTTRLLISRISLLVNVLDKKQISKLI
jgi:cell division protein FtsI/penicillin-binding protein 2